MVQLQWMKDSNDVQQLIEYRLEPSRAGTVMYSSSMFKKPPVSIYATKVKDIYIKDSYIFTTKEGENVSELNFFTFFFNPIRSFCMLYNKI